MDRASVLRIIRSELKRELSKYELLGAAGSATTLETNDMILQSHETTGVITTHPSISSDELGYLDGYLTKAPRTHSTIGATEATDMSLVTSGAVKTEVAALVDSAPGALNTLNELAAALGDDASFATTVTNTLAGKQATITGSATTIDTENLTADRALVTNGSQKVAVSAVTATELGYLDGVTSAIQTQLGAKAPMQAHAVSLRRNTGQSISSTTWTQLTFDTLRFSHGSYLTASTSSNDITVNRNGIYGIEGSTILGTGKRVILNVYLNGSAITNNSGGKPFDDDSGTLRAFSWGNIYEFSNTDVVTFQINIGEADSISGIVSMHWIGDT